MCLYQTIIVKPAGNMPLSLHTFNIWILNIKETQELDTQGNCSVHASVSVPNYLAIWKWIGITVWIDGYQRVLKTGSYVAPFMKGTVTAYLKTTVYILELQPPHSEALQPALHQIYNCSGE